MKSVILFVLLILGGGEGEFSYCYLFLRVYYSRSFVYLVNIFGRFLLATLSHGFWLTQ
jgi:hypothetical protein